MNKLKAKLEKIIDFDLRDANTIWNDDEIKKIEEKHNIAKQEATQYFLEMIRQSNFTNEWLIFDIADSLDMDREELLNGKNLQIKVLEELTNKSRRR